MITEVRIKVNTRSPLLVHGQTAIDEAVFRLPFMQEQGNRVGNRCTYVSRWCIIILLLFLYDIEVSMVLFKYYVQVIDKSDEHATVVTRKMQHFWRFGHARNSTWEWLATYCRSKPLDDNQRGATNNHKIDRTAFLHGVCALTNSTVLNGSPTLQSMVCMIVYMVCIYQTGAARR